MVVLPKDQIDTMVKILDVILRNELAGKLTVEDMKAKYSLTPEEYDMIYDLAMPFIRKQNEKGLWKTRAHSFKNRIYTALIGDKSETATKVRKLIKDFDLCDWSWMFPGGQNIPNSAKGDDA